MKTGKITPYLRKGKYIVVGEALKNFDGIFRTINIKKRLAPHKMGTLW